MGAALSVDNHITVSQNPVTQDACAGENVVFNSSATGSHIVSQWYKNGSSLPGETGGSLILSSVTAASAGSYYTTFTNSCGTVATSHATLVMDEATVITSQPAGVTLCEGGNTNFTVGATGTGLSYQWYLNGLALSEAGSFAGSQSNTLVVSGATAGDAGVILCRVTGSCGSVTSDAADLAVNATTVITLQPVNQVVCPGTNVSFGTTATGSHLSYQWQRNGTDIAGATGTTLTLNNVSDANEGLYRCRISGDCGTAYTTPASLGVMEGVSISSNPVDQQTCQGNNTGFTVSASGTALSYQWMKNGSALNDDGRITGTHTGSLQIGSTLLSDQATYSCKVTSTCGGSTTTPAALTVDQQTAITVQPVVFNAVEGGNASFSVTAQGSSLGYQWYKAGTALVNDAHYAGVTTPVLSLTGVSASLAGSYYCVVTGTCGSVTSDPGVLKVNLLTLITSQPAGPVNKCVDESASFDVMAEGTSLTFRWKKDGTDLTDDGRITGSTTPNLKISHVLKSDEGNYACLVTGDQGIENSLPGSLVVNALTDITLQPLSALRCEGDDAVLVIGAQGNITSYQWKKNGTDLSDGGRISGSSTGILTITNLSVTDNGTYMCYVQGVCANDMSNAASLQVSRNTDIISQPVSMTRCAGTSATFSVRANGGSLVYQWKKDGTDLVNGGNISGADSPDLHIENLTTGRPGHLHLPGERDVRGGKLGPGDPDGEPGDGADQPVGGQNKMRGG